MFAVVLGAHDISTLEDFYIALSRLISTNLDFKRWVVKLNYDLNNESYAYIDIDKISIIPNLRKEQAKLINDHKSNPLPWYSRPMQFSVRKRIMLALKNELHKKIVICNESLYSNNWDIYVKYLQQVGAVIEAEPIEKLGYVDSLCFVDPCGKVSYYGGMDLVHDEKYQIQGLLMPQTLAPVQSLKSVSEVIANMLYSKFELIGYLTIKFVSLWDALDNMPRLLTLNIQCGMNAAFNTLGNIGVIDDVNIRLPKSLIPNYFPPGKHVVVIPVTFHRPLVNARDDVFFKLCKMKGISFDRYLKVGTIFFLIDSIIGGRLSILVLASSRRKSIKLAIHSLNFIIQQYGKADFNEINAWDQVTSILSKLKLLVDKP